jgi:hypothetical protein
MAKRGRHGASGGHEGRGERPGDVARVGRGARGPPPPPGPGDLRAAGKTRYWFTCTTFAGGKPLKCVLLAAE